MKIMPLTIINIFAVMEIIGLAGDCHDFLRSLAMTAHFFVITRTKSATKSGSRQVIQFVWIATLTLAMTNLSVAITGLSLAKTIYFLAMIMAKSLFLVLGIILIVAFYLIEKLKKINLCQRFSVGEGEQK